MENDLTQGRGTRRSLQVDIARYQAMLDAPDLDDEQKRQFVEALWHVIVAFVDLGFQIHPVQQACGQVGNAASENPDAAGDVLNSIHTPKPEFTAASTVERDEGA